VALVSGTRLGPYEVVSLLGAGGMGEVYKCRDTRLDRLVAVKVLPAEKVADPDRKRRFIAEAKAASALNHPHIVAMYDVSSERGVDFIVMEYVQGKPLDQLILRKGLGVSETLKYATQIADAVVKTHGVGIAHRDLKPANVMVTDDGQVKVLDFGLAKLTDLPLTPEDEPDDTLIQPRVSTDGRRVVVIRTAQGNQDLWLLDGARASRFTFDPAPEYLPVWSPDSTRIVYMSRRKGIGDLYYKLTSGGGVEEPLLMCGALSRLAQWARLHRRPEVSSRSPPAVESTPCGGPTARSCTTSIPTAR
jgi:serine/threonine protein kinase